MTWLCWHFYCGLPGCGSPPGGLLRSLLYSSSLFCGSSFHTTTTLGLQGFCVQEWPHSSLGIHCPLMDGRDDTLEGMSVASDGRLCHQPFLYTRYYLTRGSCLFSFMVFLFIYLCVYLFFYLFICLFIWWRWWWGESHTIVQYCP